MAASVLVDAGFLVALISRRDTHHAWAVAAAERCPPPWGTCEAALSEAFHLLGAPGRPAMAALLKRRAIDTIFDFAGQRDAVLALLEKYADVPASLADAALVRMTETVSDPMLLTTDKDFRRYRRHGRQVIPVTTP
jgi:predicted nucleic acid-binding protein